MWTHGGKNIVPLEEMINKIKAATDAKNEENPEMVIGARTDARTVAGFEEVVRRAKAYAEAGADYVYVETPQSLYEIETLVREVSKPISFNIIPGGKTPIFELEKLAELGVKYLSVPMICLYPATKAIMEALNALKNKDLEKISHMGVNWSEFNEIVGIKKWNKLETKYSK